MRIKSILLLSFLSVVAALSSCVPARQFDELKQKEQSCREENKKLTSENQDLNTRVTELNANMEKLTKDLADLVKDSIRRESDYQRVTSLCNELNKSYDKLL